jgi:hypothetical protein
MDHSIGTLVPTRLATISRATVLDLFDHHPRIGAALWWCALQEEAISRERIVALGRRSARGRVAYLLCELVWRQRAVERGEDDAMRLPLTQVELADTLGLTSVHVNRIMRGFREDNLITLARRRLTLLDVERLQEIAGFNQDYLHFGGAPEEVERYLDRLEQDHAGPHRPYHHPPLVDHRSSCFSVMFCFTRPSDGRADRRRRDVRRETTRAFRWSVLRR